MLGIASRSSVGRIGAVKRLAMGEATGAGGGTASREASIVMWHRAEYWMMIDILYGAQPRHQPRLTQGSPGQAAEVDSAECRRADNVADIGRHVSEADPPLRLLAIDLALEGEPAAGLVDGDIVRLAEQQREADRLVGAHGMHRGIDPHGRIAAPAPVLARADAADAADVNLLPIPGDGA